MAESGPSHAPDRGRRPAENGQCFYQDFTLPVGPAQRFLELPHATVRRFCRAVASRTAVFLPAASRFDPGKPRLVHDRLGPRTAQHQLRGFGSARERIRPAPPSSGPARCRPQSGFFALPDTLFPQVWSLNPVPPGVGRFNTTSIPSFAFQNRISSIQLVKWRRAFAVFTTRTTWQGMSSNPVAVVSDEDSHSPTVQRWGFLSSALTTPKWMPLPVGHAGLAERADSSLTARRVAEKDPQTSVAAGLSHQKPCPIRLVRS